jgi:hypothetical protein
MNLTSLPIGEGFGEGGRPSPPQSLWPRSNDMGKGTASAICFSQPSNTSRTFRASVAAEKGFCRKATPSLSRLCWTITCSM